MPCVAARPLATCSALHRPAAKPPCNLPCPALPPRPASPALQAMGLKGTDVEAVVSAAEVNRETYEQALEAASPMFQASYRRRGKQLQFAADRQALAGGRCCAACVEKHTGACMDCCCRVRIC